MNNQILISKSTAIVCATVVLSLFLTLGCSSDTASPAVAPTVSSTIPGDTETAVPINRAITATFSKTMKSDSVTAATFTLAQGTTPVSGAVSYSGTTAIFRPAANLGASLVFTATLTTGVVDAGGTALAASKTWTFTSGTTTDTTAPTVASTSPANAATGVAINRPITATFSEPIDPSTITATTFTVTQGGTAVAGTVTYGGSTTVTFQPTANLAASLPFTATITTGAKDLAGNALAANKTWSFTTGTVAASLALGPAPVSLGAAGNFVILAKSGIDTVPASVITGDIGVSPIAATGFTGFDPIAVAGDYATCSQVTGKLYAPGYAAPTPSNLTTAVNDMQTAYVDAAGRTSPDFTELYAGDLSGKTLVPGLYKWGTGVSINTDVTLNGGPNDVWIFQIGQSITQANGTHVTLAGGALAKNIFWQSAGVVSIGTTAHFEGIILSQTSIALNTGASINGRLFAQTATTLKTSTVTQPAP